jgi:hypothetical protein
MKTSSAIVLLSLSAVSAFGLQPSTSATTGVRTNSLFGGSKQALVQPIGLDGRIAKNDFVSVQIRVERRSKDTSVVIAIDIAIAIAIAIAKAVKDNLIGLI